MPDPRRPSQRPRAGWLAVVLTAFALLVTGCVTVPTSGHVQAVNVTQGNAGGGQYYLQPIPVAPGRGWTPEQIVSGFLAANASFAGDHAVAREYLMPAASRGWHPGLAVTVFSQISSTPVPLSEAANGSHQTKTTTIVQVSGTVLGNLSNAGQYSTSSHSQGTTEEKFVLVNQDSQWRISSLPNEVLLSQSDFEHVYQPRNIYFFDPAQQTLVPDPVYVPQEATPTDLVEQLVRVLMSTPSGWLRGAVQTAFPAGTKVLTVSLDGGTAVVNLGGAAARASEDALHQMSAQLLWTLAGSSSDEPSIQSVELEINGSPWNAGQDNPVQQISAYDSYVPSAPAHASFYYTDSHGAVRSLSGSAQANAPQGALVAGQAGTGDIPLTQVAVSPDGRYVAGLNSTGLYTGILARKSTLELRQSGSFGSLSWDMHDNLWAAQNGSVWLVPGRGGSPVAVPTLLPPGEKVTALKVAPDGVRVAMLVSGPSGTQLMLAAIAGSGPQTYIGEAVPISADNLNFTSLTWYDADHLIALRDPSGHPVLDEVALNGGSLTPFPAPAGITSITADGTSNPLVAGLSTGQMTTLATLNGLWSGNVGTGKSPAYPG
ncbi:MAG TPA: LpqB family beta-propeller domain-containing protein [Streptosporangiaceae bacterium]|nr:LpqB family beta-propeller domain-containing protein [Streptosporangiaceae bacterium]